MERKKDFDKAISTAEYAFVLAWEGGGIRVVPQIWRLAKGEFEE